MVNKLVRTEEEALDGLIDGMSIAVGGFGTVGNAFTLLDAVMEKGTADLEIYSNNPGSMTEYGWWVWANSLPNGRSGSSAVPTSVLTPCLKSSS